ncbi:MAG: cytochrome c oxidase subunit I [Xanthomonadales bacterium PRO6]|nr:hypothetical protein [Xanthomonadales bacterium]MCE7930667.1 cytochrome c oxidase subunit I [Xanthomonadales bacterium PRO6]
MRTGSESVFPPALGPGSLWSHAPVHRSQAASGVEFLLVVPQDARRALARAWLWLGLLALIGSGVYSLLLVLARTPGVNAWLPVADFFRVALVVHVDLSVLVWFVALAGLLWTLAGRALALPLLRAAIALCGAGALGMLLAPWSGSATPVMANYIPVLDGPVFLGGLLLFGLGACALVAQALWAAPRIGPVVDGAGALHFGLNAAAVSAAVALGAFFASWWLTPRVADARTFYELLFWGGGHALQFAWTLLMLVGWLWLAAAIGARVPLSPRVALLLFALALAAVFATPVAYLAHPVESVEHRALHTWAMRIGGGLAIAPVALAVVQALLRRRAASDAIQAPLHAALLSSMLLFAAGGVIGVFIAGSNVRIPAHYHGCIVGVTLALMGLVYLLLPRLGWRAPQGALARWQPWVYGIGQLLHIVGLVWSGGYGVQRKIAGTEQVLRSGAEVAGMGVMGLGGLLAIIGGLLFVLVVWRSMRNDS